MPWNNSAFWWGESIFTTFLMEKGGYDFLSDHWQRLSRGGRWQWKQWNFPLSLPTDLSACLKEAQGQGKKRVRLTFFGDEEGQIHWLLTLTPLIEGPSSPPLKLKVEPHPHRANERPGYAKVGNYSEGLRIQRRAKKEGFDEVLFFHPEWGLEETLFGNIFFFIEGKAFTPQERKGMLSGITRHHFIQFLAGQGFHVHEGHYQLSDLKAASTVILTSSVRGLVPVIKTETYHHPQGPSLVETLREGWREYRQGHKTIL